MTAVSNQCAVCPPVKPPTTASSNDVRARGTGDAAAQFCGNTLRSLRRVVALRLQAAPISKSLHEAKRARDSADSLVWALEYESGLRERGE